MTYGRAWTRRRADSHQARCDPVRRHANVVRRLLSRLFEVSGKRICTADIGSPPLRSKAHLAAGDGVLLVAGGKEAAFFDGTKWHSIGRSRAK